MKLDIITIFPTMFDQFLATSIIKRAQDRQSVKIQVTDLRDFTHDRHRTVDDRPYGGGPGMVMKPEPLFEAVSSLRKGDCRVILLTPQGRVFNQSTANELTKSSHLIFICGHYEGVDERVRIGLADDELSIGDYILTNGNLAAMVIVDAVTRLLPGVLGSPSSLQEESFSSGGLEYPHYTRPETFNSMKVPKELLSGNHALIEHWRNEQSIHRTRLRRPDLLDDSQVYH